MWKSKLSSDRPRLLLAISFMLLAIMYPGQNVLQTTVIEPGEVLSFSLPTPAPVLYPLPDGTRAPYHTARGVIVQDVVSKTILYSYQPDIKTAPASITKLMTALVALDQYGEDTPIEVKNEDRAIGQTIELEQGENLSFKSILAGLLISSGNDAALALADNYPGGYQEFVKAMNQKASDLHLDSTVYKNPSGIDQYGHLTTPRDLATLASVAVKTHEIMALASLKNLTITDLTGQITHELDSTNDLLGIVPGLKGLKTGFTASAGECLISYVERGDHKIIVVILGSTDRFGESSALIDWAYAHHDWVIPSI